MTSQQDIGPVMVRAAALPVRFWLQGANPALFNLIHRHIELAARTSNLAKTAGLAIGEELVPLSGISNEQRHLLLSLRRDLHANRHCNPDQIDLARRLSICAGRSMIANRLDQFLVSHRLLKDLFAEVERATSVEIARLQALPGEIADASPVARIILQQLGRPPDRTRRQKKLQRDFERAWRHVARATANPTPRGWMAHVGLCIPDTSPHSKSLTLTISDCAQIYRTQSVHWLRRAVNPEDSPAWPQPTDRICVNPLHWSEAAEYFSVILNSDADPQASLMPETELLQTVLRVCQHGVLNFQELARHLSDHSGLTAEDSKSLTRYLADRGVLDPARQRSSSHLAVSLREATSVSKEYTSPTNGRIDLYRHAVMQIPASELDELTADLEFAVTMLQLIDPPYRSTRRRTDGQDRWGLAEILKTSLLQGAETGVSTGLSTAQGETVNNRRGESETSLLDRLFAPRDAPNAGTITVPEDILQDLDPDAMGPAWPLDCVLRPAGPGAPYRFVLRGVWPAGTITSRFAQGLDHVFADRYDGNDYRSFLQRIEKGTDLSFLEILAPPLSNLADNAVCRPCYTSFFTGDPNKDLYHGSSDATYVDLDQLTIKVGPNGLTCSSNRRIFWPIYHATRTCSPPWDTISRTLLAAAPLAIPASYRNLVALLSNERARSPRVMLGQHLVLCPAAWTIRADQFWPISAPLTQKLIFLADLRSQLRLPRWLEVSVHGEVDFVGCDLQSLDAIRTFERALAVNGVVRVVEMLPTPEHLVLTDTSTNGDARSVSEIILRVPGRSSMHDLADKVISELV